GPEIVARAIVQSVGHRFATLGNEGVTRYLLGLTWPAISELLEGDAAVAMIDHEFPGRLDIQSIGNLEHELAQFDIVLRLIQERLEPCDGIIRGRFVEPHEKHGQFAPGLEIAPRLRYVLGGRG